MVEFLTRQAGAEVGGPAADPARALLVIGWGNELRGDDGAGRATAEAVEAADWPGVAAQSVRQLTPELAESCALARTVVFVDACGAQRGSGICVRPLAPGPATGRPAALGHGGDPAGILAMADSLYGAAPEAWLVTIPGTSFGHGEPLSAGTREGVRQAVAWISNLQSQPPQHWRPYEHDHDGSRAS
jgi:hydrogenase maturation protease